MKSLNIEQKSLNIPPILKDFDSQIELEFDYEINSVKLEDSDDLNCKMHFYDNKTRSYRIVNYNTFWDSLNLDYQEDKNKIRVAKVINKAWCLKRLVSKQKRRFEMNILI